MIETIINKFKQDIFFQFYVIKLQIHVQEAAFVLPEIY